MGRKRTTPHATKAATIAKQRMPWSSEAKRSPTERPTLRQPSQQIPKTCDCLWMGLARFQMEMLVTATNARTSNSYHFLFFRLAAFERLPSVSFCTVLVHIFHCDNTFAFEECFSWVEFRPGIANQSREGFQL